MWRDDKASVPASRVSAWCLCPVSSSPFPKSYICLLPVQEGAASADKPASSSSKTHSQCNEVENAPEIMKPSSSAELLSRNSSKPHLPQNSLNCLTPGLSPGQAGPQGDSICPSLLSGRQESNHLPLEETSSLNRLQAQVHTGQQRSDLSRVAAGAGGR